MHELQVANRLEQHVGDVACNGGYITLYCSQGGGEGQQLAGHNSKAVRYALDSGFCSYDQGNYATLMGGRAHLRRITCMGELSNSTSPGE